MSRPSTSGIITSCKQTKETNNYSCVCICCTAVALGQVQLAVPGETLAGTPHDVDGQSTCMPLDSTSASCYKHQTAHLPAATNNRKPYNPSNPMTVMWLLAVSCLTVRMSWNVPGRERCSTSKACAPLSATVTAQQNRKHNQDSWVIGHGQFKASR